MHMVSLVLYPLNCQLVLTKSNLCRGEGALGGDS